jgi:hypothetical protein
MVRLAENLKTGGSPYLSETNANGGCVVREDNDEIGRYVGLLRRILILFAVIIAVPVILWTTAALIQYRARLPEVLNFQKLLATASINAPERATTAEPTQQQSMPREARFTNPQEARATQRAAPEGSSFVEHPLDAPQSAPSAAQTPDTSSALAAVANSATPTVERGAQGLPPFASNDGATAGTNGTMQSAATSEAEADAFSDSAPLSGPIPLPRPRPHDAGTLRTADRVPPTVPKPRLRPAAGGSGSQQGTNTDSPSVPPQQ